MYVQNIKIAFNKKGHRFSVAYLVAGAGLEPTTFGL